MGASIVKDVSLYIPPNITGRVLTVDRFTTHAQMWPKIPHIKNTWKNIIELELELNKHDLQKKIVKSNQSIEITYLNFLKFTLDRPTFSTNVFKNTVAIYIKFCHTVKLQY